MKIPVPLILLVAASVDAGANRRETRATRRAQKKLGVVTDDRFVSVAEAAIFLGVDTMTVRNMLKDGRLQAWTLGPRVLRIRLSDIESALSPYGAVSQ